jgi:hypothetical protein
MANYQQSQSYREAASFAEENAMSINSNANQAFMQWMQKRPELHHLSDVEKLMTQDPVKAQAYAERFTQEQAKQAFQMFRKSTGSSPEEVKETFEKQRSFVPSDEKINQSKEANHMNVTQAAMNKGLIGHVVNRQVENEVRTLIEGSEQDITNAKATIDQKSEKEELGVKERLKKESS